MQFVLFTDSGMCGLPLKSVQTTMGRILKETGLCLSQQLPIASTSLLHAGVLSVLSIHRSWAYCLLTTLISYVQLPAVSRKNGFLVIVHCLRQLHSFLSPLPEPWEKNCGIDIPFRAKHSIVSLSSAPGSVWGLCVHHHLLPKNAFLIGVENCTDLQVYQ